jgi:hypothetical protein
VDREVDGREDAELAGRVGGGVAEGDVDADPDPTGARLDLVARCRLHAVFGRARHLRLDERQRRHQPGEQQAERRRGRDHGAHCS